MKYLLFGILAVVIIILVVLYLCRKRWAIRKVKCMCDEEKVCRIDAALNPFGFKFDENCDIVVSKNDAWQGDFGYMDFYDKKAPFFNMVMDAEPIFFDYDGKEYRIEFWKGQYGLTTGAEIGLYVRDDCGNSHKNFYLAANENEWLDMGFILTKKCDLFCRKERTWWLTGFDVGIFSKPKELKMNICICFPNTKMCEAFVSALIKNGYSNCQLNICENMVCFDYCCPSYYKPNGKHRIIKCLVQGWNSFFCYVYQYLTRFFNRTLDKLTYLSFMLPCFYRFIICLSIPRRKQRKKQKHSKK